MAMIPEYDLENETFTQPPARQAFRDAVAQVAAKAKEKLPTAVNGRVESAVKLVLAGDVFFKDDGTIEVGSASHPETVYTLAGHACDCQDFAYGKAPEGWCQHRIAAGIAKRVGEVLAQGPAAVTPATPSQPALSAEPLQGMSTLPHHHEAPASVNVHIMLEGRQVQLTLRDTDETRLFQRLAAVLQQYPAPQPKAPAPSQHTPGTDKTFCQIHQVAMQENHKDGRTWYSHRNPDGDGWCKGRRR